LRRPSIFADAPHRTSTCEARKDQIVVGRNRLRRSADHVNLVYFIGIERIHVFDCNRIAVPIERDPL
jgi:hypothetical protein